MFLIHDFFKNWNNYNYFYVCLCVVPPPTMSYSHLPPNVTPRLYLQHTAMPVRFYLTLFMGNCVCKQQMCRRQSHTVG